jgi:hypothetical protein
LQQALLSVLLYVFDALPIYAGRTFVSPHSSPRLLQDVVPANMSVQGVEASSFFELGCCP